jgi:hypothetical protein
MEKKNIQLNDSSFFIVAHKKYISLKIVIFYNQNFNVF